MDSKKSKKISKAEYARQILIAKELICYGCKWPLIYEMLQIRQSDAQRLVQEVDTNRRLLARTEKGMYWFRASGKYNLRMIHATFVFRIFTICEKMYPEMLMAEKLLYTYSTYIDMLSNPIINNINRVFYLLNSIVNKKGFDLRTCAKCKAEYVGIGSIETNECSCCERNNYISCCDCHTVISNPYAPGTNGSRKTRCKVCAVKQRKERRRAKSRRQNSCFTGVGFYQ